MLGRSLFKLPNLFYSVVSYQVCGFTTQRYAHNQVTQYFIRAKLIDSIRLSLRSGSTDSVLSLLDDPNLDSFVVTNALRSAPTPDSALVFVEALKRVPDFTYNRHILSAIANVLAKSRRVGELKKLIEAINAGKFAKVEPVSFLDCMRWYAIAGDLDSVLCVWDELRSQVRNPCIESYNVVMGVYVRMGKDLEAVETFHSMMQGKVIPNSRAFTIVIEHLLNTGKVDAAKEIFDMLPLMRVKHTRRQYSSMVIAFSNLERFDVVKSILREMRMEGVLPPNSVLLSLQRMKEAGFLNEADEVLREMVPNDRIKKIVYESNEEDEEDNDDQCGGSEVDVIQLKPWLDPSALASALRNWGSDDVASLEDAKLVWTSRLVCKIIRHLKSPQTAWQFFGWVACQSGFKHDVHTYTAVLRKLASRGKIDLVNHILSKVKNERTKLGFSTVRQIIDFYGLFREGDAALRVFHDAKVLCDHLSEFHMVALHSSLLRTLVKCGRDREIVDMVEHMISSGTHPDIQTFSGLMHHFAVKGDFRTVQTMLGMLRQSDVEPDAYMYRTLIHAYCNSRKATLALRLFEEMRSSNVMLDGATKSLLVRSLWKEGRLREAAMVQDACQEMDDALPVPSSGNLFNVSSADLLRVYNIYCDSFKASNI